MSELFEDEPTHQYRRAEADPEHIEEIEKDDIIDISSTHSFLENFAVYENPLLNASSELIGILATIPRQGIPQNIELFRQRLTDAISLFKQKAIFLDYHPSIVEKSCFIFCAAFDEAILHTSWGELSHWENHSLLSKIFSQRNGGEVFFVLIEQAKLRPAKLINFIELQYILLMLGFKGRYRVNDESELHKIKSELYNIICTYYTSEPLPPAKAATILNVKQPWKIISIIKVFIVIVTLFTLSCIGSQYWYDLSSKQFLEQNQDFQLSSVEQKKLKWKLNNLVKDPNEPVGVLANSNSFVENQKWDLIIADFSREDDANLLFKELKDVGYEPKIRVTEHGFEIYIPSNGDLKLIRKMTNELNVRFGLDATMRIAQE